MRDRFIYELTEIAKVDKNVILITSDLGFGVLDNFVEEFPAQFINAGVAEQNMTGIATGMALEGYIPISIYPRFDFLTLATNQLVNHLDKTKELSQGIFNPKVIVRTMVGSQSPLNPGPQHYQDHTEAYKLMLTNIHVKKLEKTSEIIPAYIWALKDDKSSLLVEYAEHYVKK